MNLKKNLTLFFLFLFALGMTAQQPRSTVTLTLNNVPLSEAIQKMEEASNYTFFYDASLIDMGQTVSLHAQAQSVPDALAQMFQHANVRFELKGNQIILYPKENRTSAAKKQISGTVVDADGEPLIGVTVYVKGNTSEGTITDIDGKFSMMVNPDDDVIISYVGFNPKEYAASLLGTGSQITMDETSQQIKEVTVVGYGTQKKASVIGSITSVQPATLNVSTSRSLSNDLAGSVAGIIGVQRSGEPGYDNSEFWIRGISSFQGTQSPLVLVDGIERSLNIIDIAEIESFSVLKDASASAVYGVRGANGVILITTKKGYAGKTNVNFTVEHSITQPTKLPDFLGSTNYLTLLNNIAIQNGEQPLYAESVIDALRNGYDHELYPDVDWIDAITNDVANNTRVSFDLSGGNEKLRYSFVGAYYNEQGITVTDPSKSWDSGIHLNRFNLRSNVDVNLTNTTLLTINIGGYLQRRNAPTASIDNVFATAFKASPFSSPVRYDDGRIPRPEGEENAWALLTQTGFQRNNQSQLETLFALEQDLKFLLPGLKLKGIFSFDSYSANSVSASGSPTYYPVAYGRDPVTGELLFNEAASDGTDALSYSSSGEFGNNATYVEVNMSYDHTFGDHYLNGLLLYNQRDYDDGGEVRYRHQGIAGRAAYTYKGRYIAEFNFGYNGSENFARGMRFGFFPSGALGWIMSEEPWMEPVRHIFSKIKFRGSYGLVGNDQLSGRRFAYITTIAETGGYQFGPSSNLISYNGLQEGDVGVSDLTWETVKKANIGLELGLWNMLEIQADFFHERRENIFLQRSNFPNSAGFAQTPWANYGIVANRGLDLQLTLNKQITKDWFLSVRGSLTYAKNKIIEQDEEIGKVGTYRSSTGGPVNQIFGLVAEGLYTEDDFVNGVLDPNLPQPSFSVASLVMPGDIKYKDMNDDGVINSQDETGLGVTVNPELVYGFGLNTSYKQFDFGFFFQGNGRTSRMIGRDAYFLPGSTRGVTGNIYANAVDDAWTEENPRQDVFYPRLHIGTHEHNAQASTWWLKDMSMLRLKNVEIGYSVPTKAFEKIALASGRVFIRGTNLFQFSKFKLWDPELDTTNGLKYPIMRSYSIGLQLKF